MMDKLKGKNITRVSASQSIPKNRNLDKLFSFPPAMQNYKTFHNPLGIF